MNDKNLENEIIEWFYSKYKDFKFFFKYFVYIPGIGEHIVHIRFRNNYVDLGYQRRLLKRYSLCEIKELIDGLMVEVENESSITKEHLDCVNSLYTLRKLADAYIAQNCIREQDTHELTIEFHHHIRNIEKLVNRTKPAQAITVDTNTWLEKCGNCGNEIDGSYDQISDIVYCSKCGRPLYWR